MEFLVVENNPSRAKIFENLGIDYIFVDLEKLGKQDRQSHIDSVKSNHSIHDILKVKKNLTRAKVLVRIDPINNNSKNQIDQVIDSGADIIMLPYFTKFTEVEYFYNCINGRVKTMLLFEHIKALEFIDLAHKKFNFKEVYFGLNDLSLSLGYDFMFEVLANKILDKSIKYCNENGIKFGIGGVGIFDSGKIPGQIVMREYKRLGASFTIVSRGLVNLLNQNEYAFSDNLVKLRSEWNLYNSDDPILKDNFDFFKKLIKVNKV
jgi:hypothetical protein